MERIQVTDRLSCSSAAYRGERMPDAIAAETPVA